MPMFQWDNSYSIGNEEIDRHHEHLFEIFNALYDGCVSVNYIDCLGTTIDDLVAYADYHFSAEEAYMKELGYQGIEKHKAEHIIFRQRVAHLQQTYNDNDVILTKEVIVYLGNWLMKHVMIEDMKLARKSRMTPL